MRGIEITPEDPVPRLVEIGVAAEEAGFDTAFASSHYNNRDPFVALSAIADATDRIAVGPGVANPYETHPVSLAARMATLEEVSNGRAIYGIGAGDRSTLANLGIDRERPLKRVHEAVSVSRALFAGERVTHQGTFAATDAALNFSTGAIPIWVGGQGPGMLRMAAACADGVLINGSHPDDLAVAADRIEAGLKDRPDDLGPVETAAFVSTSVAADARDARAAARPPVAFIAAGAPDPVLERHDIDREAAHAIGDRIGAGDYEAAFEAVTDAMLDAFAVAGTPAEVGRQFEAILEHVDGLVAASPLGPNRPAAVPHLATAMDRAGLC